MPGIKLTRIQVNDMKSKLSKRISVFNMLLEGSVICRVDDNSSVGDVGLLYSTQLPFYEH